MNTQSFRILTEAPPQERARVGLRDPISGYLNDRARKDPIGMLRNIADVGVGVGGYFIGKANPKAGAFAGVIAGWALDKAEDWAREITGSREAKDFVDRHDKNGDGRVDNAHDFRDYRGIMS